MPIRPPTTVAAVPTVPSAMPLACSTKGEAEYRRGQAALFYPSTCSRQARALRQETALSLSAVCLRATVRVHKGWVVGVHRTAAESKPHPFLQGPRKDRNVQRC